VAARTGRKLLVTQKKLRLLRWGACMHVCTVCGALM
jgi:hypothetical protein